MFLIVAIVIGVLALGIVGLGFAIGVVNGFKRGLASVIAVVIAAIVAALLTFALCSPSSALMKMGLDFAVDGINSLNVDILQYIAVEKLGNALIYYAAMIVAPFFFVIVFAVLALLLSVFLMLGFSFIPILKRKKKNVGSALLYHLGGAAVGLLCGIIVSVSCVFPIVGVASIAENTVSKVPDEVIEKFGLSDTLNALPIDIKSEHKVMQYFDYVGFGMLYDAFASATLEDEKVYLREEIDVVADIAVEVLSLDFEAKKINEGHVEAVRGVVENLDRSALIRDTLAGVASEVVKEDGPITPETLGLDEVLQPVVAEIFTVISTTDKNTLTADLTTLVDVVDIMVERDILNTSNYKYMLEQLGDGVITELLVVVTENERMRSVADEITVLSIRVLAKELGVPADSEERYELVMNEVAYVLNESRGMAEDERRAKVIADLGLVFDNYGIKIEGEALENVADGLVADLGAKEEVNATDVQEFFIVYGMAKDESGTEASKGSGMTVLTENDSNVVIGEDGTITVGGVVLENYTAESYRNSAAYTMGHNGVEIGDASSLTSADDMISSFLTASRVVGDLGHYSDCEDVAAECEKVGALFSEMINVLSEISLSEFDAAEMIGGMGHVLDLMTYSEIFGSDSASDIITMVLQSDTVMDSLGLKRSDMTDFANKINSYAEGREHGYEEATKTIASTVNTITKATDKYATSAEKTTATAELINNINKDNAEMISSMITGDMIGNFGSVAENTETVSDSLKSLIDNMANYKEGNPDEASVNKEAEAVTTILSLAIIGSGEGSMFDKKDEAGEVLEQGAVGSDPDSFITTVVESEVVMGTVTDTVKNNESNPFGVTYDTEEEKQEVASALENYYAENATGDDEELKSKLQDLAIVMDVEIDLDQFAD